jgi:hypothetical protein
LCRNVKKLSWKEWKCWTIITLGYKLIKKSSGFRKATTCSHHTPGFDSDYIFLNIITLMCSLTMQQTSSPLRLFCLRFDDEIIGCRHRSSREWRKNNEINMCVRARSRIIKCIFSVIEGYRELDNQAWKLKIESLALRFDS